MKRRTVLISSVCLSAAALLAVVPAVASAVIAAHDGPVTGLVTRTYGPTTAGGRYVCLVSQGVEACQGWNPASTVEGHRSETEAWRALVDRADVRDQIAATLEQTPRS